MPATRRQYRIAPGHRVAIPRPRRLRLHGVQESTCNGSLVNTKVIESIGGRRAGSVGEDRQVEAWSHRYRFAVETTS